MSCFIKYRSSPPEILFLGKDVLKICSKFTGEHPGQSVISISCFAIINLDIEKIKAKP